jgi:hypothetical protein
VHMKSAIFVYSLLVSHLTFPMPDDGQYHNLQPWIMHQIHLNAFTYQWECCQTGCGFSHLETSSIFVNVAMWEHYTFDCDFDAEKFTTLMPLLLLIVCKISFQLWV